MRTQRTFARWLVAASVYILIATPVWWIVSRPQKDVGQIPLTAARPSTAALEGNTALSLARVEVHSARLSDLKPTREGEPPVRLSVPALGVNASVIPVGVEPSGSMEVPKDVATAGWYRFGAAPGSPGSAMLIGHVDSRTQGPGIFFRLATLGLGQSVVVDLADGSNRSFVVVARRFLDKDRLTEDLFARHGPPRLTLVTCGGGFDERTRSYSHNIVVYAVPDTS